jgi:hypothetical protein
MMRGKRPGVAPFRLFQGLLAVIDAILTKHGARADARTVMGVYDRHEHRLCTPDATFEPLAEVPAFFRSMGWA